MGPISGRVVTVYAAAIRCCFVLMVVVVSGSDSCDGFCGVVRFSGRLCCGLWSCDFGSVDGGFVYGFVAVLLLYCFFAGFFVKFGPGACVCVGLIYALD